MNYKPGSQQLLIRTLPEGSGVYMFMNTTNKGARGWQTLSKDQALKKLTKNCGMYEVIIHDKPRQVYFDLDFRGKDHIESFKNLLLKLMPDANINISGSIQEFKTSYHVVIDNYYFENVEKQKCLVSWIKQEKIDGIPLNELGVDTQVYDRNRNFKCIGQSKVDRIDGKARMSPYIQKYISGSQLVEKHLVCSGNGSDAYEIFKYFHNEPSKTKVLKQTPFELTVMTNTYEGQVFDIDNDNVCNLFLNSKSLDHWDHMVSLNMCLYFIQLGKSFEEFWSYRKFKRDTPKDYQKWKTQYAYHQRKEILSVERELDLKRIIVAKLGGFYTNIGLDHYTRIYRDNLDVKATRDIKRIELLKDDLKSEKKVVILANNMGAGKTNAVLELSKDYQSACFITCRTSLQKNVQSRSEDFTSYNDLAKLATLSVPKTTQKKAKENLPLVKKLIITPNSIHYVGNTTYDLVIIDEVEVFLNIWSMKDKITGNSYMVGAHKGVNEFVNNYYKIIHLLKNAKKIVLMDALISYRSFRYLIRAKVVESVEDIEVITSSVNREPTLVKHLYVEGTEKGENDHILSTMKGIDTLIKCISNKKKIYVFWPYVTPATGAKLTRLSQKELINLLEDKIGRKLTYYIYNADESKESLMDVNKNWADVDLILVNQSITVGVSYTNEDYLFDHVFIFDAPFVPIREIVQTSKRCRQLSEGGCIYYIDLGGYNNYNYVFTKEQENNILIKNTVIDTQNELIAKKDFKNVYYTFIKAGFKFEGVKSEKVDLVIQLNKYIDTNYLFENIDVNGLYKDQETEEMELFNLHDKLSFLKKKFCWYFSNLNIENAIVDKRIAKLWNQNKDFCFSLLKTGEVKKIGTDEKIDNFPLYLISKLYDICYDNEDADITTVLESKDKLKIINELRQESLSTTTYDMPLLKMYLNTYYRTTIIESKKSKDDNNNYNYYFNKDNLNMIIDMINLLEIEPEESKCMFENIEED